MTHDTPYTLEPHMLTPHCFVAAIHRQEYFDPRKGSILNVEYSQLIVARKCGKPVPLARKYARFRAFLEEQEDITTNCLLWAKSKDMRFELDHTCFLPMAGDRIVLLTTPTRNVVVQVVNYETFEDKDTRAGGCWVRFVVAPYEHNGGEQWVD